MNTEHGDVISKRVRWLAITTGILISGLSLFGYWNLLGVAMIAGGLVQPRSPGPGRWIIWAGAFGSNVILITMSFSSLTSVRHYHDYVTLGFSALFLASTVLLLWCDVELVLDEIMRLRAQRALPHRAPQPVSTVTWLVAAALNLWAGSSIVFTCINYHDSHDLYIVVMSLLWVVIAIAVDVAIVRRSIKVRHNQTHGAGF